ncbi:MAG: hypothetical protein A2W25_06985 [candidate division Zixibacteria bacterium RBG_16_53_22]|nr:MAG: hypothetical protein A2W25_06985 [candidate division Zixibacteria bacterium RBG_16_53_22]
MYKIVFLTLIAILALGVSASAQDPGMPDSAAAGNWDCSPFFQSPNDYFYFSLLLKNDEDLRYFEFSYGLIEAQADLRAVTVIHPISTWDVYFDTLGIINPDYPNYTFFSAIFFGEEDDTPLNTDSLWQPVLFLSVVISPNVVPGDTIQPILLMPGIAACASPIIVIDPTRADDPNGLPLDFAITAIAPNPFNAQTTIHYLLPEPSEVSLTVYDILGRRIETLDIGYQSAGAHSVTWDGTGRNSGIYFARVVAGGRSQGGRMVLVK